jgi:hypothetical protein
VPAISGWSTPFEDPISDISTLRDAANHIQKLPKADQELQHWQAAALAPMMAAEGKGPLLHARVGMLRAMNHGRERVFFDRKETINQKRFAQAPLDELRFSLASSWTFFINVCSGLQQISHRSRSSLGMICLPSAAPLIWTCAQPRLLSDSRKQQSQIKLVFVPMAGIRAAIGAAGKRKPAGGTVPPTSSFGCC